MLTLSAFLWYCWYIVLTIFGIELISDEVLTGGYIVYGLSAETNLGVGLHGSSFQTTVCKSERFAPLTIASILLVSVDS